MGSTLENKFPAHDYQYFQRFLAEESGIELHEGKQYLVFSRIHKIMENENCGTLKELIDVINRKGSPDLKERVIEAMTTNETFWFRDHHPFETLQTELLPSLLDRPAHRRIRLWSAACSSGQEAYSLSMSLEELKEKRIGKSMPPVEITASDISSHMLSIAEKGQYNNLALSRGLSEERKAKFFDRVDDNNYRIKPAVGRCIQWRKLNLLDSFSHLGKFDIVFCRNVLMYFSATVKTDILTKIRDNCMEPGAYLILGASERIPASLDERFEMLRLGQTIVFKAI